MTSQSNWAFGKCPYCDMPNEECDCSDYLNEPMEEEDEQDAP